MNRTTQRGLAVLAAALLAVVLVAGFGRLRLDTDVLGLLPPDLPAVRGLRAYQECFGQAQDLVITLESSDAASAEAGARSLAERLRSHPGLAARVHWQAPWLEDPAATADLSAWAWFNQPPEVFATLADRLQPEAVARQLEQSLESLSTGLSPATVARAGFDPLDLARLPGSDGLTSALPGMSSGGFASADGTFRILRVTPAVPTVPYPKAEAWLGHLRGVVEDWRRAWPGSHAPEVGLTGGPAFTAEIASGMERDLRWSVPGTMAVILLLFYTTWRAWRPLGWLLALLTLTLALTTAVGALVFGTLNVVSLGFAAVLLGLVVDYGLVLYQEAVDEPALAATQLRQRLFKSIAFSAVTTAGAFALLTLVGLPGLGQLGALVAIGTLLGAAVMLLFMPMARPRHGRGSPPRLPIPGPGFWRAAGMTVLLLGGAAVASMTLRPPRIDPSPDALRPTGSRAYAAMEKIQMHLQPGPQPLWVLVPGADEADVLARLERVTAVLEGARSQGTISAHVLPSLLWPAPAHQQANRQTAARLAAMESQARQAVLQAGFTGQAWALAGGMFGRWRALAKDDTPVWPEGTVATWVTGQFVGRDATGLVALGLVRPAKDSSKAPALATLSRSLAAEGAWLSGWELLGQSLLDHAGGRLQWVAGLMGCMLVACLLLAFGSVREAALSLGSLAVGLLWLQGLMSALGWEWNLMSLMAWPLLLGSGVDYSIHLLMAVRRHCGDAAAVVRTTGKALALCAGTTMAGFGSLAFSSNSGLASLGWVCFAGMGCIFLAVLMILPTSGGRKAGGLA